MRKIKTHNESNKNKQVDRKIRLKSCLIYVFLLSLLPSCSKDEAFNQSDSHEYHTISIRIGEDTHISRAANQAGSKVKIEDLVLFTVGKESRTVLNTSSLEKQGSDTYSCRIPSGIDLPSAEFYAIANFKANFGAFASFEHKPFDEFLDQLVASTYEDNNSAATSSSTSLSYPLLNREAATYNSTTGTISDILLSHLPARIYLDCERLGYPIESITFNNVSRTTFLRTVIEAAGNGNTDELFDWTDDQPGIAGDGTDYYYLVYPSNRQASVTTAQPGLSPIFSCPTFLPASIWTVKGSVIRSRVLLLITYRVPRFCALSLKRQATEIPTSFSIGRMTNRASRVTERIITTSFILRTDKRPSLSLLSMQNLFLPI